MQNTNPLLIFCTNLRRKSQATNCLELFYRKRFASISLPPMPSIDRIRMCWKILCNVAANGSSTSFARFRRCKCSSGEIATPFHFSYLLRFSFSHDLLCSRTIPAHALEVQYDMLLWASLIDWPFYHADLFLHRREKVVQSTQSLRTAIRKADGLIQHGKFCELLFVEAARPEDQQHQQSDLIKIANLMKHALIAQIASYPQIEAPLPVFGILTRGIKAACCVSFSFLFCCCLLHSTSSCRFCDRDFGDALVLQKLLCDA